MGKKMYRSKNNKIIGGVCGGIGEYFKIDPLIIRLTWGLLTLTSGVFALFYIVAMVLIPVKPDEEALEEVVSDDKNKKVALLIGIGLVIWGSVKLLSTIFEHFDFRFSILGTPLGVFTFPVLLIIGGIAVIVLMGRNSK